MTKTLEQIQKENRKLILEAIHGCSYEEALKKELGFGCKVLVQHYVCGVKDKTEILTIDKSVGVCDITGLYVFTGDNKKPSEIIEIIGKPITLDRLLLALPHEKIKIELDDVEIGWHGPVLLIKYNLFGPRKFYWRLEKKTILLTHEEQSEETLREINKLLNGLKICQEK